MRFRRATRPISDIGRPADVSMLSSRDREQSGGRVAGQWRFTHVRDPRYVSWRTFSMANAQVSPQLLGDLRKMRCRFRRRQMPRARLRASGPLAQLPSSLPDRHARGRGSRDSLGHYDVHAIRPLAGDLQLLANSYRTGSCVRGGEKNR